jgi:hypothetical protein
MVIADDTTNYFDVNSLTTVLIEYNIVIGIPPPEYPTNLKSRQTGMIIGCHNTNI